MQNAEFDRKVKELMDGHLEMPDSNSWDQLQTSLASRRAKVVFFRVISYGSVAVAASLLFFLVINRQTPSDVNNQTPVIAITAENQPAHPHTGIKTEAFEQKTVLEKKVKKLVAFAETKNVCIDNEVTDEASTGTTVSNTAEPQKTQNSPAKEEKAIKEQAPKTYAYDAFREKPETRKRIMQRLTYGMSTNFSPSVFDKSISMLSVSLGYQNDFVSSSLKETLQPQSVSDTRYSMPLSFGIQAQLPLNGRLSLGTGVSYTLLVSQYDNYSYNSRRDIQQSLHYLGIPVNLYYNLLEKKNLKVYLVGGGAIEKCVFANYRVVDNGVKSHESASISGVQLSLNGGLGLEYSLSKEMGLYFDPAMAYFFDSDQPDNIRTAQPLQYKFELGMRFHL